jgi:hypothetical protein
VKKLITLDSGGALIREVTRSRHFFLDLGYNFDVCDPK